MTLHGLSATDEAAVREAIGALEIVDGTIDPGVFSALDDPALRKSVSTVLEECGRTLIKVGDGWTTGYRDDIADTLAEQGIGVLAAADRAVLVLVLLRSVAIPRARGNTAGKTWGNSDGVRGTSIDELKQNRDISRAQIVESVRRLHAAGLVGRRRGMLYPGPALLRLTPQRAAELWENLLLVAAPDSIYARALRARRAAPRPTGNSEETA
jgi:hypothetical protein